MLERLIKMTIVYFIGVFILAFAIVCLIQSAIGTGAFDSFYIHLGYWLKLGEEAPSTGMYVGLLVAYVLTMILKPRANYIVGVILAGFVGVFVGFWIKTLPPAEITQLRVIYFLVGVIVLPLGAALMVRAKFPLVPTDRLLLILVEKTKIPVGIMKIFLDLTWVITAVIIAMVLGHDTLKEQSGNSAISMFGQVGLGTLVLPLITGPILGFYLKFIPEIVTPNVVKVKTNKEFRDEAAEEKAVLAAREEILE